MTVDEDLVRHCLRSDLLGREKFMCPALQESLAARQAHEDCDDRAPLDVMFEWLVQALAERNEVKRDGKKFHRLTGQIAALQHSIALLRNPWRPDPEKVMSEAAFMAFVDG